MPALLVSVVTATISTALIALLGIPLGELWNLGPLAADCAADGRYTFFVTSAPLNIRGGVSSTAAAIAIK